MSKLMVFQRQASAGVMVTLRLTRGEDITGRITELDDSHVCVDVGLCIVTIFDDILAGWEIHQSPPDTARDYAAEGEPTSKASAFLPPPGYSRNTGSRSRPPGYQ